jgi:hypothetical protein
LIVPGFCLGIFSLIVPGLCLGMNTTRLCLLYLEPRQSLYICLPRLCLGTSKNEKNTKYILPIESKWLNG